MYTKDMRTTIEIKPEHRARLLELAARRGEKGFSSVIGEAIESYLRGRAENERLRASALKLRGILTSKEADALRNRTAEVRASWR
jgi:predicted DNA-binding protein